MFIGRLVIYLPHNHVLVAVAPSAEPHFAARIGRRGQAFHHIQRRSDE